MSPLKAWDLETLPVFQGFGLWYFGTHANALTFASQGWEIADGSVSTSNPNYTKPNRCDGLFVQGATDSATTGGVATHYHTIADHNHGNVGTATLPVGNPYSWSTYINAAATHVHATNNLGSAVNTLAASNNPYYVAPIPMVYCLAGAGTGHGLPRLHDLDASCFDLFANAIGWTESTGQPANYYLCDGTNGTPNTIGKFLRGVSSGSGTANGGADHTHYTEHSHGQTNAGAGQSQQSDGTSIQFSNVSHTHPVPNVGAITSSGAAGGTGNLIPPYKTLRFVMFTLPATGGPLKPWDLDASVGRIPSGLSAAKYSDGAPTNYTVIGLSGHHLKHAAAGADYTSGGVAAGSHTHGFSDAHSHGMGADTVDGQVYIGSGAYLAVNGHTHTTGTASWTRVDAANNEPPAINVLFCQRN